MIKKSSIALSVIFIVLFIGSLLALLSPFLRTTWLEYVLSPQTSSHNNGTSIEPWSSLPSLQPAPPLTSPTASVTFQNNTTILFGENQLAGTQAPLLRFNQSSYNRAIESGKLVVLYFYSDTDKNAEDELPEIIDAFNQLSTDQVIGFVVHINDSSVTEDELSMSNTLRANTPNTKVFIKNNKPLFHISDSWDQQAYLNQITQTLTSL